MPCWNITTSYRRNWPTSFWIWRCTWNTTSPPPVRWSRRIGGWVIDLDIWNIIFFLGIQSNNWVFSIDTMRIWVEKTHLENPRLSNECTRLPRRTCRSWRLRANDWPTLSLHRATCGCGSCCSSSSSPSSPWCSLCACFPNAATDSGK